MRASTMNEQQFAAMRRSRREAAVDAVGDAIAALVRAEAALSLWADGVSQVIEREWGIGPGDEDQMRRLDHPEYCSALATYGVVLRLREQVGQALITFQALRCPACDPETESGRRGETIRQQVNGDLVCQRCGCVVAPAPSGDVPRG